MASNATEIAASVLSAAVSQGAISSAAAAASSIAASVTSVVLSAFSEAQASQETQIQEQPTQTSFSTITVENDSPIDFTSIVVAPAPPPTTFFQTSVVTVPAPVGGGEEPQTVVVTITSAPPAPTVTAVSETPNPSPTAASTSPTAAILHNNGTAASTSSGGLSAGGKTAVAVVVPVVVVALLVLAGILLWRRRKNKKSNEEARRKEVEDYNFNPNEDPTLPVVIATGSSSPPEMTDGAGYRGWGNSTHQNRKASTTVSGPLAAAAMTEYGTANGNTSPGSPTQATPSDHHSSDPLVAGTVSGTTSVGRSRRETMDSESIAALGAAPLSSNNRSDMRRGPSNASSSYSAANRSEESGEHPLPVVGQDYSAFTNYGNYGQPIPYEDAGYGGGQQPVIRDVPARRNTRIENPAVFPQQGNAGIAQNF